MRPKDYIDKKAAEAALKAYQGTQLNSNQETSPYFIGEISSDRKTIKDPEGRQYRLIFTGNPKKHELAQRLSNDTAVVNAAKAPTFNVDGGDPPIHVSGATLEGAVSRFFIKDINKEDIYYIPDSYRKTITYYQSPGGEPKTYTLTPYIFTNKTGKFLVDYISSNESTTSDSPTESVYSYVYRIYYVILSNYRFNKSSKEVEGNFTFGSFVVNVNDLLPSIPASPASLGIPNQLEFQGPGNTAFIAYSKTFIDLEQYARKSLQVRGFDISTLRPYETDEGGVDFCLDSSWQLTETVNYYIRINKVSVIPQVLSPAPGITQDICVINYYEYESVNNPYSIKFYPLRTNDLIGDIDPFLLSIDSGDIFKTLYGPGTFYNFINFPDPLGPNGFRLYTNGESGSVRTTDFSSTSPGGINLSLFPAQSYENSYFYSGRVKASGFLAGGIQVDTTPPLTTRKNESRWKGVPFVLFNGLPWNNTSSVDRNFVFSQTDRVIFPDVLLTGYLWIWLESIGAVVSEQITDQGNVFTSRRMSPGSLSDWYNLSAEFDCEIGENNYSVAVTQFAQVNFGTHTIDRDPPQPDITFVVTDSFNLDYSCTQFRNEPIIPDGITLSGRWGDPSIDLSVFKVQTNNTTPSGNYFLTPKSLVPSILSETNPSTSIISYSPLTSTSSSSTITIAKAINYFCQQPPVVGVKTSISSNLVHSSTRLFPKNVFLNFPNLTTQFAIGYNGFNVLRNTNVIDKDGNSNIRWDLDRYKIMQQRNTGTLVQIHENFNVGESSEGTYPFKVVKKTFSDPNLKINTDPNKNYTVFNLFGATVVR